MNTKYDALLVVSFGGPESREDVIPFLENTVHGRTVPRERLLKVAEHYYQFNGRSPINDENREIIRAIKAQFAANGPPLPVYWGNRNWRPLLAETIKTMKADGVKRALAFVTSAYSSYSGCRQYRENIEQARGEVGGGTPQVDKLRVFYNHPRFVRAWLDCAQEALDQIPRQRRETAHVLFTAHSIPVAMASHCRYVQQLEETCRLISEALGRAQGPLVYQSRSGSPAQPWLGPDLHGRLREIAGEGSGKDVLILPVGFISDHMEIVYDLDTEAAGLCRQLGLNYVRARTPGSHPEFICMIRDLVLERMQPGSARPALGRMGANHDVCPADCCLP